MATKIINDRDPVKVAASEVAKDDKDVLSQTKAEIKDSKQALDDLNKSQGTQTKVEKDADKAQAQADQKQTASEKDDAAADADDQAAIERQKAGDKKGAAKLEREARKLHDKARKEADDAAKKQEKLERKFPVLGTDGEGNDVRVSQKEMQQRLKAIGDARADAVARQRLKDLTDERDEGRQTEADLINARGNKPATPAKAPSETSGIIKVVGSDDDSTAAKPVVAPTVESGTPNTDTTKTAVVVATPAPTELTAKTTDDSVLPTPPAKAQPVVTTTSVAPLNVAPLSLPGSTLSTLPLSTSSSSATSLLATPTTSACTPVPTTVGDDWLQRGSTGTGVVELQKRLNALGFCIPDGESGTFGPQTYAQVWAFQNAQRGKNAAFMRDGIAGPQTMGQLRQLTPSIN